LLVFLSVLISYVSCQGLGIVAYTCMPTITEPNPLIVFANVTDGTTLGTAPARKVGNPIANLVSATVDFDNLTYYYSFEYNTGKSLITGVQLNFEIGGTVVLYQCAISARVACITYSGGTIFLIAGTSQAYVLGILALDPVTCVVQEIAGLPQGTTLRGSVSGPGGNCAILDDYNTIYFLDNTRPILYGVELSNGGFSSTVLSSQGSSGPFSDHNGELVAYSDATINSLFYFSYGGLPAAYSVDAVNGNSTKLFNNEIFNPAVLLYEDGMAFIDFDVTGSTIIVNSMGDVLFRAPNSFSQATCASFAGIQYFPYY